MLKILASIVAAGRGRFFAAYRTLRIAQRYRIKRSMLRPIELTSSCGIKIGYVDKIEVFCGTIRVIGWATCPKIKIESELQSIFVDVNIYRADLDGRAESFGFDAVVNGTDFLKLKFDEDIIFWVNVASNWHRAVAWLKTFEIIITILFQSHRDIVKWFIMGDSVAGMNLEMCLIPRSESLITPIASSNLFEESGLKKEQYGGPVDIILPIYNAYDDLCACLDRFERHTASTHRLIIIEDASTDQRIGPLISEFLTRRHNVKIIKNSSNLGFVVSVNLGISMSSRHVILLNSDALVAEGWLDRLMAPIYADVDNASVTPMTNNGEIASVPVICRASALPEGMLDRINSVAMLLDPLKAVTDVPTGVGFCMAISRYWLERVPSFDVAFGRGYGEEVDWCQRVAAQGARHVLTGAVFVEHRGGMSFGSEKAQRISVNNRMISQRYPKYDSDVAAFILADSAVGQRLVLGLAAADLQVVPVPVYLGHRLGGGAEHWLVEEVNGHLGLGQSVAVLRDGDILGSVLFELHGTDGVTRAQVPLDDLPKYLSVLTRFRLVYSNLVAARAPLDVLSRAVSALKPFDELAIVFHDFLPLCPSYNLIGTDGAFCGLPEPVSCQRCYVALTVTSGQRPATIGEWRSSWRQFLDMATEIVVFSEDSRKQIAHVWPHLFDQIEVRPHRPQHLPKRITAYPRRRFTVGVLGGIGYSKGAKVLRDLAAIMADDMNIVVIGKLDPDFTHTRITVHGSYDRSEIATLTVAYEVDCWLIPSIWPETFCYAAHEALATGLPVFVYDLGAQGCAAAEAENGHLIRPECTGADLERHLREYSSKSGI